MRSRSLPNKKNKVKNIQIADEPSQPNSLKGEYHTLFLLLFLYFLQGIPMGLSRSVPLFMESKGASYADQALFTFVRWPYSLKLFWAPIVDAVYSKRFGRRKTWVVPVQIITGIIMIGLGSVLGASLEDNKTENKPFPTNMFVASFFLLYLLVATQDIAVDGWALSLFSEQNKGYAAICNSVGQVAGYMTSYVGFLALNSADFCNEYLRKNPSETGMVSFMSFMQFWGFVFIFSTILIAIFQPENPKAKYKKTSNQQVIEEEIPSIVGSYQEMISIATRSSVIMLAMILITKSIGFMAIDAAMQLQFIKLGVPKATLAMSAIVFFPVECGLPWLIGKYLSGKNATPMTVYLWSNPFKVIMGLLIAVVIYFTTRVIPPDTLPTSFYAIVLLLLIFHRISDNAIFVSQMAFFARISDPTIGGTYMTLLNTIANLGGMWPAPIALMLVGYFDKEICEVPIGSNPLESEKCQGDIGRKSCIDAGGNCVQVVDGFMVVVLLTSFVGFIWFFLVKKYVYRLQSADLTEWRIQ